MDKVRLGLVGCGGFMRHRLKQSLCLPEVEVVGMADVAPDQMVETKEKYPEVKDVPEYPSMESMLKAGGLDAVLLATPHKFHCEQVVMGFGAGLHVLVEKPLSCSIAEAQRCIEARDKSGKVGAVSYQRHGLPEFQWIRNKIASQEYGKLLAIGSMLCQDWKKFTTGTWRQVPDISQGGMLNDSGSHIFDIMLWTTGLRPKTVSCILRDRGTPVEVDSVTSVDFEGGAIASVCVMGEAPTWHERHVVTFEGAILTWTDNVLEVQPRDGEKQTIGDWPEATTPDKNFVDSILGRAKPLAPFECGMDVVRITQAAYASAGNGGLPAPF
ncbi:MAG TPA: Gfo/Idh/MocA family oxidoreductase [Fimbriimonadaceae bacterium]|nr:Gfo/Idh/MocA family oxidoreductase [Fimbriimonadaceae bacterium]